MCNPRQTNIYQLTIRYDDVSCCVIFVYELKCESYLNLEAQSEGDGWHWKENVFVFGTEIEAFLLSLALLTQSHLQSLTLKNAFFVKVLPLVTYTIKLDQ